jgi:tRNA threonylcarbamoyl adenosine modification protein (Sua5/YciO/YrdC/YwlC family)
MARLLKVDAAIAAFDAGDVVAIPTDTVYGFAAEVSHPAAVAKLFALKERPATVPVPVLVDSVDQIAYLGVEWNEYASRLGRAFWPGALTIIVPVPHDLAVLVGSETDTVGFRIPDDDLIRRVIAVLGPLAVSSANHHGQPACRSAFEVLEQFRNRPELAGVVDGGERSGDVSAVVDLTTNQWRVVREGSITVADIARVLA